MQQRLFQQVPLNLPSVEESLAVTLSFLPCSISLAGSLYPLHSSRKPFKHQDKSKRCNRQLFRSLRGQVMPCCCKPPLLTLAGHRGLSQTGKSGSRAHSPKFGLCYGGFDLKFFCKCWQTYNWLKVSWYNCKLLVVSCWSVSSFRRTLLMA